MQTNKSLNTGLFFQPKPCKMFKEDALEASQLNLERITSNTEVSNRDSLFSQANSGIFDFNPKNESIFKKFTAKKQ